MPIEKLYTMKHIYMPNKNTDFNKNGNREKKRAVPCVNLMSAPLNHDQMSEFQESFLSIWKKLKVN